MTCSRKVAASGIEPPAVLAVTAAPFRLAGSMCRPAPGRTTLPTTMPKASAKVDAARK
ncbi:MAG: hypothetical protein QM711_08285 [Micropruina sp.]